MKDAPILDAWFSSTRRGQKEPMTAADLVVQLDALDPSAEIFVLVERENQASLMAPVTEVFEVAADENSVIVLRVADT